MGQQQKFADWLSPVFIAGCAALLFVETCVIGHFKVSWPALTTVFFSALLAYSVSRLRIRLNVASSDTSKISGKPVYLGMAITSILIIIPCLFFLETHQLIWMSVAAINSFFYLIPVKLNNNPVSGWRSIFLVKNILLSVVWTITTVIIPAGYETTAISQPDVMFILARRFLFIYCLATLYDIPDLASDLKTGVHTIPARLGKKKTITIAAMTLALFIIIIIFDKYLSLWVSLALLISAFFTVAIMFVRHPEKHPLRYKILVDSAMAIQALLVMMVAGW